MTGSRPPTTEEIENVQRNLPVNAGEDFQWYEDKISAILLATDYSMPQTVRQFWLERVTETFEFVDVNESGSGRPLSQIHVNAKEMLDYWDKRVDAEGVVSLRRPMSFGSIDVN